MLSSPDLWNNWIKNLSFEWYVTNTCYLKKVGETIRLTLFTVRADYKILGRNICIYNKNCISWDIFTALLDLKHIRVQVIYLFERIHIKMTLLYMRKVYDSIYIFRNLSLYTHDNTCYYILLNAAFSFAT